MPSSAIVRRSPRILKNSISSVQTKTNRISKKNIAKKQQSDITTIDDTVKKAKKVVITATTKEVLLLSQGTHFDNAIAHIKKNDPKLAPLLDTKMVSSLRNTFTKKADNFNAFQALLTSIVYQQIHGKAAEAILGRFLKLFDNVFPTAEQVLGKDFEDLRSVGLSSRKAEYIRDLATKFNEGTITPDKFTSMSPKDISTQLCSVKGIGQWTVDMFLMHDLHHSDILPLGDLAVRKGVANHFGIKLANDKSSKNKVPAELAENSEIWRPYRTIGSVLMWKTAGTKTVGDQK